MDSRKTKPKKNRRKHHLFHCFKPDDGFYPAAPRSKAKTKDPLLSYMAEKQGIVFPTVLSSARKGGAGEGNGNRRRKTGGKESPLRIRQALIAALNHTTLGKRIINRRKTKKNTYYNSRLNHLEAKGDINSNTEPKIIDRTNSHSSYTSSSHCSSLFTPSSLSSSIGSSSSQTTQFSGSSIESYLHLMKQDGFSEESTIERKYFGSEMALCFVILTSLLILILWGKFFAIICTSVGFFVMPLRRRECCIEEGDTGENIEFDSVQENNKFIIEGIFGSSAFIPNS